MSSVHFLARNKMILVRRVERLSCHNNQHVACETSTTSSHDPFSENAESKAIIGATVCGASDAADMPSKVPSHAEHGNDLPKKRDVTDGDVISYVSAVRDVNVAATDHNVEVDKKEVASSGMHCAITKRMTVIEEMEGMDVLCSDKTGTRTLNKLSIYKNLIEVFAKGVDKDHVMLLAARASRTENQDDIDVTMVGMLADPKEIKLEFISDELQDISPTEIFL